MTSVRGERTTLPLPLTMVSTSSNLVSKPSVFWRSTMRRGTALATPVCSVASRAAARGAMRRVVATR